MLDNNNFHQQQQPSTSSSSTPTSPSHNPIERVNRRVLGLATAAICQSAGFHMVQAGALETLVSTTNRYLNTLCSSSREHCEHAGRSIVNPGDIYMALINSGLDLEAFPKFLQDLQPRRTPLFTLKSQSPVKSPPVLRISDPRPHPSHFPSFLPSFPDSHTYMRTEVKDDIDSNYEKVRRLNARNRRDTENSLINYALAMHPSVCLFQELSKRLQFEAKDKLEFEQKKKGAMYEGEKGGGTNGAMATDELENGEEMAGGETSGKQTENGGQGIEKNNISANGPELTPTGPSTTTTTTRNMAGPATSVANIHQELLLVQEEIRPKETEHAYVLKRIPPFCHVLLPFDDPRPSISAMVTDDVDIEEEHNYFAQILSKEMEDDLAENDEESMEIGAGE